MTWEEQKEMEYRRDVQLADELNLRYPDEEFHKANLAMVEAIHFMRIDPAFLRDLKEAVS